MAETGQRDLAPGLMIGTSVAWFDLVNGRGAINLRIADDYLRTIEPAIAIS